MGLKATIDGAKNIDAGIYMAHLEPDEAASLGDCSTHIGPFSIIVLEKYMAYSEQLKTITFDPATTRVLNVGTSNQAIIIDGEAKPPSRTIQANAGAPVGSTSFVAPTAGGVAAAKSAETVAATPPPKPAEIPKPITAARAPEPIKTMPPPKPMETIKPAPSLKPGPQTAPAASASPEYVLSQPLSTGDKLFLSELPPELRNLGEKLLSEVRKHFPGELSYEPRAGKFDETPEIFWTVKIQPQDKSLRLTVRGTPNQFPDSKGLDLKIDKFGYSAFVLTRMTQLDAAVSLIRQGAKNMMA